MSDEVDLQHVMVYIMGMLEWIERQGTLENEKTNWSTTQHEWQM